MRVLHRVRQAISYWRANRSDPPVLPPDALAILNEPMLHQFRILQPGDQRHLINVYRYLVNAGADQDTVIAGLIHDVGKGCMKCRITLLDRTLDVILDALAPGLYRRFGAQDDAPAALRGLHRLASHARRGALAAAQAGYNPRICELILHHDDKTAGNDSSLDLLLRADDEADARDIWRG
jgi:hypothetical protein